MIRDLAVRVQTAIDYAAADAEFVQASSALPCGVRLVIQGAGSATTFDLVRTVSSPVVRLSADPQAWERFAFTNPPVGFHSFTAAMRDPSRLQVEGEPVHIAQCLHALERFFEILRGQVDDQSDPAAMTGIESVSGHYVRIGAVSSAPIFYERAGNAGNPAIVMLHTAGADSRQYHHLLSDPELQASWDMYAFDMPAHGRSMPAPGSLWRGYRLDKETYASTCLAFMENVIQKPAVVLGCSMGAAMALHLGKRHPARVAGVIALEAPYRAKGRRTPWLAHPQINQAAHNPSYVRGLMSPTSPLHQRRTAAWIYSQGGHQVYSGDLAFYSDEFDAEVDVKGLDGRNKPVYLLTGAYDYSATPADSKRVAALVPGARFIEMPDLGHFPMIENPDVLLAYLKPVMRETKSRLPQ